MSLGLQWTTPDGSTGAEVCREDRAGTPHVCLDIKPGAPLQWWPAWQLKEWPQRAGQKKPTKYRAKRCEVDGITFASRAEMRRYLDLRALQSAGEISGLELQPVFVLAPGVLVPGEKRKRPALRYVADFRYRDRSGAVVVEDAKGVQTDVFRVKLHLMAITHPGVAVRLV